MNKNGIITKFMFCSEQEGVHTQALLQYNTRIDHIGFTTGFEKQYSWSGIVNNKTCTTYLGITIAEQLLVKVFNHVERMPNGNKGFDIICNQGYKIDIKSATKGKNRERWGFNINHNKIANYFLCLAFDDRKNLNPLHIWLIPSKVVNCLSTLAISESRLDKWNKYELSDKLDKVIGCYNIMKGDN